MASSYKFPVPKFNFEVQFPKGTISFQEVTGLDQENEFLEYRSGKSPNFITEKRAGMRKSGTVSFKKGIISSDTDITDFYNPVNEKKDYFTQDEPPNITITLRDEKDSKVMAWELEGVVPIKLSNGDLKSDENAFAIEQLDVVHAGIKIK